MNFAEYSAFVKSVAGAHKNAVNPLEYFSVGLFGEAGELANVIKKIEFHKHPFDDVMRAKLVDEAGDVIWYLTAWLCATNEVFPPGFGWTFLGSFEVPIKRSVYLELCHLSNRVAEIMRNRVPPCLAFSWVEGNVAAILKHYGATLDEAIAMNVVKLRLRYPNGFTEAASLNRTAEKKND